MSDPVQVPGTIVYDQVVPARAHWSHTVRAGQTLRIIDLEGNQAVDCLLYSAADPADRYSASETLVRQRNIFLGKGTQLLSCEGTVLMTITEDSVGHHDTIAGACSQESNTLRYGQHTRHQHACADNFLFEQALHGGDARDLVPNINWFMYVPVEEDGSLGIVDGLSAPGKHVDLRAEIDVRVVVSNCPQINNPCNGFNPTPVRMVVYE